MDDPAGPGPTPDSGHKRTDRPLGSRNEAGPDDAGRDDDRSSARPTSPPTSPPAARAAANSPLPTTDVPPFAERRAKEDGSRIRPPTPRVALVLLAAVVLLFVLWLGRGALTPFIFGLLVVYLLDPPVERLARFGLPRWLAVLLVYVAAVFIVVEALSLMLRPLVDQITLFVRDLPRLTSQLDDQLQRLSEVYRGLDLPPQLRTAIDSWIAELVEKGADIDPGILLPFFGATAGFVTSIFGYILVPVWAFYLLKDRRQLTVAFDRALPESWRADVWAVIRIVQHVFGQWIRAQVVLGVTVGVATFVGLLVLGATVDPVFARFALLLAIVAGLFELLPVIGPIISAIPALLLGATVGVEAVLAALVLYTLVQQVENNVLVPKIQGSATELHPSAVMLALVVGASIAGLVGAILALPITATGRSVFRYLFRRLSEPHISPTSEAAMHDPEPATSGAG